MSLTAKVKLDRGPPEAPLNVNVASMYGESVCSIAAVVAMLALVISEFDPANHSLSRSPLESLDMNELSRGRIAQRRKLSLVKLFTSTFDEECVL